MFPGISGGRSLSNLTSRMSTVSSFCYRVQLKTCHLKKPGAGRKKGEKQNCTKPEKELQKRSIFYFSLNFHEKTEKKNSFVVYKSGLRKKSR
jgi:hypothetical protein